MAITQATSANRLVKNGPGRSLFESGKAAVTSSSTWVQGVFLCLDSSSHYLRPVAATGDAATLVGLSDNVVNSGVLAGPYDGLTAVNAAQVTPDFAGPKYGVVGRMTLKTGDAFTFGCKVYLADGADSATVSVSDPGDHNYVGIFVDNPVASAAAGQVAQILIGARYPNGTGGIIIF